MFNSLIYNSTHTEQDPCNLAEKSPQETNVIDNLNEPMADVREEKENAKSYPGIDGELETCGSHKVSTGESKPGEDKTNIPGTMVLAVSGFTYLS